ncbi:MAG TPA: tetratricopeptide repeat protein [Pedobacter sp.]|nr:tetratricopeptide repeat protein [Pedobacter sp.]
MKGKWFLALAFAGIFSFASVFAAFAQQPAAGVVDTNAIKALFFEGLREKLNENYAKAGESFTKILVLDPNHAAANYEVAVINFRQNKLLEAEIAIKKATVLDTDNLWYWRMLAELYKRKGDMDALVRVFNQMIRLAPDDESFYFDRSNAFLLAGRTAEALKGYDEIERKFGVSDALVQARERVNADKEQRPDRMGADVAEHLLSPEQQLLAEGEKLFKQGDLNGALTKFEAILKMTDQFYIAWEHTMSTQVALGLYKEAIKTGEDALALYPSQAALYFQMAVALLNEGNADEALVNIRTAIQLDEGSPVLTECYGDVLFLKGDKSGAVVQWKKARAAGNNSGKLKKKIDEQKYIK